MDQNLELEVPVGSDVTATGACSSASPMHSGGKRRRRRKPRQAFDVELEISGLAGSVCTVMATSASNVREVKEEIKLQTDIPSHEQRLFKANGDELSKDTAVLNNLDLIFLNDSSDEAGKEEQEKGNGKKAGKGRGKEVRENAGPRKAELMFLRRPTKQAEILAEMNKAKQNDAVLKIFREAGEAAHQDRTIVLEAVRRNHNCLQLVSREFWADRQVMMNAVKTNGMAIRHASPELLADKELVIAAVRQNPNAVSLAAPELRNDLGVMLLAIQKDRANGEVFRLASDAIRSVREVVLTAVKLNGLNLAFAHPKLCSDREIAIAAVTQNSKALKYVGRDIRGDDEILNAAGWKTNPLYSGGQVYTMAPGTGVSWLSALSVEPLSFSSLTAWGMQV